MEELERRIGDAVERELDMRVRKTLFTKYREEDGTPIVKVDVWLRRADRKVKDDLYSRLIPLVDDTVREADCFDAYPLIVPHIAHGQQIDSKLLRKR